MLLFNFLLIYLICPFKLTSASNIACNCTNNTQCPGYDLNINLNCTTDLTKCSTNDSCSFDCGLYFPVTLKPINYGNWSNWTYQDICIISKFSPTNQALNISANCLDVIRFKENIENQRVLKLNEILNKTNRQLEFLKSKYLIADQANYYLSRLALGILIFLYLIFILNDMFQLRSRCCDNKIEPIGKRSTYRSKAVEENVLFYKYSTRRIKSLNLRFENVEALMLKKISRKY